MRSLDIDTNSQPIRNLLTNPSCETASGTVSVWKNLVTNPRGQAVATGTTTVRTNLCLAPRGSTAWVSTGSGTGGVSTTGVDATGGQDGGPAFKQTWTTAATSGGASLFAGAAVPVTAGVVYTVSALLKSSQALSSASAVITWYDSTSTQISVSTTSAALAVNTWVRQSCTATAPTGAVSARVGVRALDLTGTTAGLVFWGDQVLLEQTDQVRPYFSGASVSALGWAYAWTGTANASTSTAKCAIVSTRVNLLPTPASSGTDGWSVYAGSGSSGYTGTSTNETTGSPFPTAKWLKTTVTATPTSSYVEFASPNANTAKYVAVTAGLIYAISVYGYSSVATNFGVVYYWLASDGVTSAGAGVTPSAISAGVATRKQVTLTAPAGAVYLRVAGRFSTATDLVVGTVISVSAAQVEQVLGASVPAGTYFDGTTASASDFNYGWTGTANASTSAQTAPQLASFGTANGGVPFYSWVRSISLNTAIRVTLPPAGSSGNQGTRIYFLNPTLVSTSYTVRAWVYVPTGSPNVFISAQGGGIASTVSGTATTVKDAWVEISVSFTTLATASTVSIYILNAVTVPSTPGNEFYVDKVMVNEGTYTGLYFDGDNPLVDSDFTTAWSGTANASVTTVNGVGLPGWATNVGTTIIQSGQWASNGGKSARLIGRSNSANYAELTVPLVPGRTYTVVAWLRFTTLFGSINTKASLGARYYGSAISTGWQRTTPNIAGQQEQRYTFTIPTDATSFGLRLFSGFAGDPDVWFDSLMIVEGTYTEGYSDGNTPGWKWDGTAHASTSVGYPYSLGSLVGQPALDYENSAATTLPTGLAQNISDPVSIYTVHDLVTTPPANSTPGVASIGDALNDTASNTFNTYRYNGGATISNSRYIVRRTGGSGATGVAGLGMTGPIRVVSSWGITSTGNGYISVLGSARNVDSGVVMLHASSNLQTLTSVYMTHIRTIVFKGAHSEVQAKAVQAWLANRYGFALAA